MIQNIIYDSNNRMIVVTNSEGSRKSYSYNSNAANEIYADFPDMDSFTWYTISDIIKNWEN